MPFKSKPEAMSHAIFLLTRLKKYYSKEKIIDHTIALIKTAFENHAQNMEVVCRQLMAVNQKLLPMHKLTAFIAELRASDFKQSPQEKFENPWGRRAESELFSHLFTSPTPAMMYAVNRVSREIVKTFISLEVEYEDLLDDFLKSLMGMEQGDSITCGTIKHIRAYDLLVYVKKVLIQNNPENFAEIMQIHFKFGKIVSRNMRIADAPVRAPVGKLAKIIRSSLSPEQKPEDFFSQMIAKRGPLGSQFRGLVADNVIYHHPLFTAVDGSKGRLKHGWTWCHTQKLNLMLHSQADYELGLPLHTTRWSADCRSQAPDFKSPYVIDAIENDVVYVSGSFRHDEYIVRPNGNDS